MQVRFLSILFSSDQMDHAYGLTLSASGLTQPATGNRLTGNHFWLRISMDRISDSDSEDAGSIPAGATTEQSKEIKTA